MVYKKRYNSGGKKKRLYQKNKVKKMVTGREPTMLEKIASGAGAVAKVAASVAPIVAAINTEEKFFDNNYSANAYNPGTNDSLVCLTNNFSQGTGEQQRIGNSILARSLYFRAYVEWLASTTVYNGLSRMILFVWKDNANQNTPTVAKVLQSSTNIMSPINKDYSDQMVILKDKIFNHQANVSAAIKQSIQSVKVFKNLDFHIRWTGTGTSGTQNHVYILFMGAAPTAANQSSIAVYSRLLFTDN